MTNIWEERIEKTLSAGQVLMNVVLLGLGAVLSLVILGVTVFSFILLAQYGL